MGRVEIGETAFSADGPALDGALVSVYRRSDNSLTTVYAAESGGTTLSQPLTTNVGRIEGWVDEGSYRLYVSKDATSYSQMWEAIRGDNIPYITVMRNAPLNVQWPEYAALGDNSHDDSSAIQGAMDAAGTYGAEILIPNGRYIANNLQPPVNKAIRLKGMGHGRVTRSNGGKGTTLRRTSTANPLLNAAGTGSGSTQRVYLDVEGIGFEGTGSETLGAGSTLVSLNSVNDASFKRVSFRYCGRTALRLGQVWNSSFTDIWISDAGSGVTYPALLFDAVARDGVQEGSDTVHFANLEIEHCSGTEMLFTGRTATSSPTSDISITNLKMECNINGTHPWISLDYCQLVRIQNFAVKVTTSGRTGPLVLQGDPTFTDTGQGNMLIGGSLDSGQANGLIPYYIDVASGGLIFLGECVNAPQTAYARIQTFAGTGDRIQILGRFGGSNPVVEDHRSAETYFVEANGSRTYYVSSAPSTGRRGDRAINILPSAGGVPGWSCTNTTGPVWKAWGNLAA